MVFPPLFRRAHAALITALATVALGATFGREGSTDATRKSTRSFALKVIHQLGVSLRELAPLLNCSPSLLSHLLQAGQASIEDCVFARLGALSTRAPVRSAKMAGTHCTARGYEEIAYELERTAIWDSQAILRWLDYENVAGSEQEQVNDQARIFVSILERASQFQRISMAPVVSMADMIQLCGSLDRHNLFNRHVKSLAEKLGLSKTVDFRSFRTMHASLMRRFGARIEVACDNMGHAGSSGSITLDVYSKTWWSERVEAVSRVVEAVFAKPDEKEKKIAISLKGLPSSGIGVDWEPSWEPQPVLPGQKSV